MMYDINNCYLLLWGELHLSRDDQCSDVNISLGKDYDLCFENYIKRANTLIIYLYYLFVSHQDNVCKKNHEYSLQ